MESFATSCEKFFFFPENIIQSRISLEECKSLFSTLEARDNSETYKLFEDDGHGSLTICELPAGGEG
jgi:hypothetical protein